MVLAARREERLARVVEDIRRVPRAGRALAVVTDVEREDDIVRLALSATREMGPVDILVNNAGHGYVAPVVEVDTDELDRVMRVNFRAAVLCTKHMVGGMVERRSGAVVNIASVSSKRGWAGGTPYVASKFALRGFAQCLWPEVRDAGVRVINLYPDYVATEFFDVMQIPRPGPEQILTPDGIAQLVMSALCLPPSANVVELEVAPTASG